MSDMRSLPHSRACGWGPHEHGTACSRNCPTCHGVAIEVINKDRSTSPFARLHPITQNPNELAQRVSALVGDIDDCVFCGYAFTYSEEGCDACNWVKDALRPTGRLTAEDR